MKLFKPNEKSRYATINSHMGAAMVISPEVIRDDASIGPGISLSDLPNFASMAEEQIASIGALPTFHQSGANYYAPQMEGACLEYCHVLRSEYERYIEGLDVTYLNALLDEKERLQSRIGEMCIEKAKEHCKAGKQEG